MFNHSLKYDLFAQILLKFKSVFLMLILQSLLQFCWHLVGNSLSNYFLSEFSKEK